MSDKRPKPRAKDRDAAGKNPARRGCRKFAPCAERDSSRVQSALIGTIGRPFS